MIKFDTPCRNNKVTTHIKNVVTLLVSKSFIFLLKIKLLALIIYIQYSSIPLSI